MEKAIERRGITIIYELPPMKYTNYYQGELGWSGIDISVYIDFFLMDLRVYNSQTFLDLCGSVHTLTGILTKLGVL